MNASACLRLFVLALAAVLALPREGFAAARRDVVLGPAAATPPAAEPAATPAEDPGDLTAAREAATARRVADPTPANFKAEGELAERAGDYVGARVAYEEALGRMGPDDSLRASTERDLARVRERARGVVPDEGASTHRAELDRAWAGPPPKKTAKTKSTPIAGPAPADDRIVKKWYFWVTIGAIVASAAAVTGIAIKAARDDKPDALDRRAVFGIGTGALRF